MLAARNAYWEKELDLKETSDAVVRVRYLSSFLSWEVFPQ